MEIVTPVPTNFLLPEGTCEVRFAEDQPEFLTLPALVTPQGHVVSQWKPTPGELALLNEGVPVTVTIHHGPPTPENPLRPLSVAVGGVDLR